MADSCSDVIYKDMMRGKPSIAREYLARVLALDPSQAVERITVDKVEESNTALTIRFSALLTESDGGEERLHFFAKTVKDPKSNNAYRSMGTREAEFYQFIRNKHSLTLPIARCYDAYLAGDKSSFFILLQDVSGSHIEAGKCDLADGAVWLAAAESLAALHAAHWNAPDLPAVDGVVFDEWIRGTYEGYDRFRSYVGDRMDGATWGMFEHAVGINVDLLQETRERLSEKRGVTLTHGDSHIYNFLLPKGPGGQPVIVDFQFWGAGIGAGDLAHLTRVSFPDDPCGALHRAVVEQYHRTLVALGIREYPWERCWEDYQRQIAVMLLIPVWQYATFGLPYVEWICTIPKLAGNYAALGCEQIKGSAENPKV